MYFGHELLTEVARRVLRVWHDHGSFRGREGVFRHNLRYNNLTRCHCHECWLLFLRAVGKLFEVTNCPAVGASFITFMYHISTLVIYLVCLIVGVVITKMCCNDPEKFQHTRLCDQSKGHESTL